MENSKLKVREEKIRNGDGDQFHADAETEKIRKPFPQGLCHTLKLSATAPQKLRLFSDHSLFLRRGLEGGDTTAEFVGD